MVKTAARVVPATQFKAQCLALIDRVAEGRGDIIISKRGRPVARLVPVEPDRSSRPLLGSVTIVDPDDDLLSTNATWEAARRTR